MPIIRDLPIKLEEGEVLRQAGFRKKPMPWPDMIKRVRELIRTVHEGSLLQPAVSYELFSVVGFDKNKFSLGSNMELQVPIQSDTKELALVVCTIGHRIEEKAAELFAIGERLNGWIMDCIGSAAVETLTQEACEKVKHEAADSS